VSNLEKWEKLARPPVTALKTIQAGRLKGKSDINPQWRYKAMTEVYGPCGEGWKYSIDRLWIEPGANDQVMAFAQISLYVSVNGHWSDPIPGVGGSMLVAKEKDGLYTSDEAFKMAITDALSVALKMLGVGADIYMGMWDGSKYKDSNPVADAIIKADVRPMAGAGQDLTQEEAKKVSEVASRVLDWINSGSIEDAVMEKENAALNTEETLYFWTFFDSKQKTAMKNEFSRQKTVRLNKEAVTQG
jgi:hypothetical protein